MELASQDKYFKELDELSKKVSDRERLVAALNTIYRDELKRASLDASEIYDDWRNARFRPRPAVEAE
jgi:hypothetical protein